MKTYNSMKMFTVPQVKMIIANTMLDNGNRRYKLIDISGGNSYGYTFELVEQVKTQDDVADENGKFLFRESFWKNVRTIATSQYTHRPHARNAIGGIGAYGPTFDRAAIVEVL